MEVEVEIEHDEREFEITLSWQSPHDTSPSCVESRAAHRLHIEAELDLYTRVLLFLGRGGLAVRLSQALSALLRGVSLAAWEDAVQRSRGRGAMPSSCADAAR